MSGLGEGPGRARVLIAGSAGAIPALLYFGQTEMAVRHGGLLLGEPSQVAAGQTGFAHGAAGIAWALVELWHATGEQRFRAAAWRLLDFERACFDPVRANWRDFGQGSVLPDAAGWLAGRLAFHVHFLVWTRVTYGLLVSTVARAGSPRRR